MADASLTSGLERATKQVEQFQRVLEKTNVDVNKLANNLSKAFGGKGGALGGIGGGTSVMPSGTFSNLPPMPNYAGGGFGGMMKNMLFAAAPGAIQMGTAYAMGKVAAMPNVQATMGRATSFYNAGVSMGLGGSGMAGMQSATFSAMRGGITSTGSDSMVAEYLGARGMAYSNAPNSAYMQTVTGVANAAKYLNMSNERSVAALEGLTSGATSRSLLNNLGIYTSDLRTGDIKTQGQIMGEIAQRLTAGRKTASVSEVEESFRRGNLGASLAGLGLTDDQQQIMKQYLIERAKGNNMDLSNSADMDKLIKASGINPAAAQYQSNTYDAAAMNEAQGNYIKAINDVLPKLKDLSEQAGKAASGLMGYVNAQYSFMQGNQAGAADVAATMGMAAGGANILGGLLGQGLSMFGGGGGRGGGPKGGGGGAGGLGKGLGKGLGIGGKLLGGLGIAGGLIGGVGSVMDIIGQSDQAGQMGIAAQRGGMSKEQADKAAVDAAWSNAWGAAGSGALSGATIGAGLGSIIPGLGTLAGGLIGGAVGGLAGGIGSWFSTYNAQMGGYATGGPTSTINSNGPTGKPDTSVTFVYPVNAKITDGYGPRVPPTAGASSFHRGIDFGAAEGTPIVASARGVVTMAGNNGGLGTCVQIKHPNGMTTVYGHQSRLATGVGREVQQGQVIGYVGNTGTSTGAHLHFETHDSSGNAFDPMKVLSGTAGKIIGPEGSGSKGILGGGGAAAPDLSSVIDARAKSDAKGVQAYSGASIGSKGIQAMGAGQGVSVATSSRGSQLGLGASKKNNLTSNTMGIYLAGAPRAKDGDSYVAQDGPVNVHAGEAILTSQQADTWRKALQTGQLGGGKGNHVEINVTIAQASEAEARKFAAMVKDMLEHDSMIHKMGSR